MTELRIVKQPPTKQEIAFIEVARHIVTTPGTNTEKIATLTGEHRKLAQELENAATMGGSDDYWTVWSALELYNPKLKDFRKAVQEVPPSHDDTRHVLLVKSQATITETIADLDTPFVLDCLEQAEWGDSLLFAQLFRGKALYDHSANEWYLWQNHYWELDESNRIKHYVSGHLASVYIRAGAALNLQVRGEENAEEDDIKARVSKLKGQIKSLTERAFQLRQVSRNKNVLTFASSQLGMSITAKQWDRNPWLLAVPNGVIDLQLGQLRDGKPEDYIRTVCPTEWKGLHEPAQRWERFLREIFELKAGPNDTFIKRPEPEIIALISFISRLFGYGITGDVREHVFTVLYGSEGRNGKDTIQRAL